MNGAVPQETALLSLKSGPTSELADVRAVLRDYRVRLHQNLTTATPEKQPQKRLPRARIAVSGFTQTHGAASDLQSGSKAILARSLKDRGVRRRLIHSWHSLLTSANGGSYPIHDIVAGNE
jgi:hypothetical protein